MDHRDGCCCLVQFHVIQKYNNVINEPDSQQSKKYRPTFKKGKACGFPHISGLSFNQGTSTPEQADNASPNTLIGPDWPTGKYFSEEYFPDTVCPW